MSDTPHRYTAELAGQIEVAWQDRWQERGTFHAPNPAGPWADPERSPRYPGGNLLVLDMFPYPSGAGLHVGHPLGYIATDVFARFNRMLGKNVLHCLGYDAFGLPAEQYAVQTGQHPRKTTEDNIVIMARQLRRLGLGHDDRRAIQTIDPRVLPLDPVDLPADLQLLVRRGCRAPRRRPRPGPPDRRARRGVPLRCPRAAQRGRPRLGRPQRPRARQHPRRPAPRLHLARRRSTGAPASARCSPTRRSPTRAAPSVATSRSSSATCASG